MQLNPVGNRNTMLETNIHIHLLGFAFVVSLRALVIGAIIFAVTIVAADVAFTTRANRKAGRIPA